MKKGVHRTGYTPFPIHLLPYGSKARLLRRHGLGQNKLLFEHAEGTNLAV